MSGQGVVVKQILIKKDFQESNETCISTSFFHSGANDDFKVIQASWARLIPGWFCNVAYAQSDWGLKRFFLLNYTSDIEKMAQSRIKGETLRVSSCMKLHCLNSWLFSPLRGEESSAQHICTVTDDKRDGTCYAQPSSKSINTNLRLGTILPAVQTTDKHQRTNHPWPFLYRSEHFHLVAVRCQGVWEKADWCQWSSDLTAMKHQTMKCI